MSFYSSQVGKNSSRYCNSNLYGTNLSSVYADGPPPLDDSTQDEDDDEMVFKSTSREKSVRVHENVDKESSKQTDFQPWPAFDTQKNETTIDDDFGDFSSFADFSSAFGNTKETKVDSPWFGTNGECAQPSGTFLKDTNQGEIKSEQLSNSDDEFGCFSGGDESDFEGSKSFSCENEVNNISNGIGASDSPSQHGVDQNNIKRSDFFSDDDDDFDDFQAPNNAATNSSIESTDQLTNSSNKHIPSGFQSKEMPSIFSDDDDDDDEFGEFGTSNSDNHKTLVQGDEEPQLIISESEHKEVNISPTFNKENDSSQMKSKDSVSEHETKSDSFLTTNQILSHDRADVHISKDDDFGDFSTNFDTNPQDDNQINGFAASSEINGENSNIVHQSDQQEINDNGYDEITSSTSKDDGDSSAVSNSCTQENINDNDIKKPVTNLTQNDDDFGEFPSMSHSDTKAKNEDTNSAEFVTNSPQSHNDYDDDFGDFASISTNNEQQIEESMNKTLGDDTINSQNNHDEFGDFSADKSEFGNSVTPFKTNSNDDLKVVSKSSEQSSQESSKDNFGNFNSGTIQQVDDDDFGDFADVPVSTKPAGSIQNDSGERDDFGDFSAIPTVQSTKDKQSHEDDSFRNLSTFSNSGNAKIQDNDDDFGEFGEPSSIKSADDDDFGEFGVPSSIKSKANDDDFGEFGEPSSIKSIADDDDFGDFSECAQATVPSTQENKGFSDFKTLTESTLAHFSTPTKSSDNFGNFSSTNQSSVPQSSSSQSFLSTSTASNKESAPSKVTGIFQPEKNSSITVVNNLVRQSFVNVQADVQRNMIVVMLQHEIQSGKQSVWEAVKGAERNGSLRFEWVASDHKLKMLESLSMLPVRIQTSANFKSSGPVQTPLFASGLGLLEPVKGVITPFHHVEEVDPSQDPFGAPPEVGIPDLGFGGNGNVIKKETFTGHSEVKDNADSISVSSSLDLDFLAPSGSTGDLTKTEGKALYEDDLLGLGMQFSAPNESPRVFNGSKDQKKIFKFNNTTVSFPSDDKNLSEQAKKMVNDFEDLSFMLSKVLMFPLKSKE